MWRLLAETLLEQPPSSGHYNGTHDAECHANKKVSRPCLVSDIGAGLRPRDTRNVMTRPS